MKYFNKIILTIILLLSNFGCQSRDKVSNKINVFQSENLWEHDTQYFNFLKNESSIKKPLNWDIKLTLNCIDLELNEGSCIYSSMCVDPVIEGHKSTSMAIIKDVELEDVYSIPVQFLKDKPAEPVIGSNWMDDSHEIVPNSYILKTCIGEVFAFQISDYEYKFINHQLTDIQIQIKNLNTNSEFKEITFNEAYTNPIYYSFKNGFVEKYNVWDLKLDEYSFWLGGGVNLFIQENSSIKNTQLINEDEIILTDKPKSFITQNWYNYNHKTKKYDYNKNVYVLKLLGDTYIAFQVIDYYDDKGKRGFMKLKWKYLSNE